MARKRPIVDCSECGAQGRWYRAEHVLCKVCADKQSKEVYGMLVARAKQERAEAEKRRQNHEAFLDDVYDGLYGN